MKTIKIFLVALVGVLAVSCYNDFDTPKPAKLYTDEDMALMGLTEVSIKEVKDKFGPISGTGTNDSFATTKTLKFGTLTSDEESFDGLSAWPEAANYYIKGKVTSSDRQGNIYKSLFIDDGTAGIELKLYSGLYLEYFLNLDTKESQWVYVRLDGLYLGNYRMMLSIGGAPSDGINMAGTHKYYANSNVDNPKVAAKNFFPGERTKLDASNIIEANTTNYTSLGQEALGRLVYFKDVKIKYAGVTYQNPDPSSSTGWGEDIVKPGMLNGSNTNPYPSWIVTDWGTPEFGTWYRWAYNRNNVRLYGSVIMVHNEAAEYTSDPGVYSIRTSGYSQFAMNPIPADGSQGNVLGIYGIYSKQSTFEGGKYDYAQYQISVSRIEDLDFKKETLLTDEWIKHNTPSTSYSPNVKNNGDDSDATE